MIITRLSGGLGNQMFQYAIARNLAEKNNSAVKLDVSFLGHSTDPNRISRDYALDIFNFPQTFASAAEIAEMLKSRTRARKVVAKISRSLLRRAGAPLIGESSPRFDPSVLRARGELYLSGFWQSEKYFANVAPIIREEFTIAVPPSGPTGALAERIESDSKSVAVHVRRGDYESNPRTQSVHGLLPMDYYRSALSIIAGRIAYPHCYVFSDDVDWARINLSLPYPITAVETASAAEDFRLMALCRHFVIANSSFSWWAAWLSRLPGKIVVAPRTWYVNPSFDSSDLVPSQWIRV